MATRGWGYWTEAKLDILSAYLPAFASASKRAGRVVYLDLFAGNDQNHRRDTGADIKGSAVRAIEALPESAELFLFELPRVAAELEERLGARFPGRRITVVSGDSNETLAGALASIRGHDLRWAPMFAFVDPYASSSLRWATLEALADFKRDKKYKVELWLLFFGSNIPRVLGQKTDANAAQVTRTFGCDDWVHIARARDQKLIDGARAKYEYTNLMRWRIQHVLGYTATHALEIKNTRSNYLYDLIFATDNRAGDDIMRSIYAKAVARNERMRQEALEHSRQARTGQSSLFAPDEIPAAEAAAYHPEPPTEPFRIDPGPG